VDHPRSGRGAFVCGVLSHRSPAPFTSSWWLHSGALARLCGVHFTACSKGRPVAIGLISSSEAAGSESASRGYLPFSGAYGGRRSASQPASPCLVNARRSTATWVASDGRGLESFTQQHYSSTSANRSPDLTGLNLSLICRYVCSHAMPPPSIFSSFPAGCRPLVCLHPPSSLAAVTVGDFFFLPARNWLERKAHRHHKKKERIENGLLCAIEACQPAPGSFCAFCGATAKEGARPVGRSASKS